MKRFNILIILGLFVLLAGFAQPAYAGIDSVQTFGLVLGPGQAPVAQVNRAIAKLEGTVNAYSTNQNPKVAKQTFAAVDDLSSSLEELNAVLEEVYSTLSEGEQLAVREAYSSLGAYLEDLAVRTNSVFGREFLKIIIVQDEEEGIDSVQTFGLVLGPGQ